MSDALGYLWFDLEEPSLLCLANVAHGKVENGEVMSFSSFQYGHICAVKDFIRNKLGYYREDTLPDMYCKDVGHIVKELFGKIESDSSNLRKTATGYYLFERINQTHPELFKKLRQIVEKYITYANDFRRTEGTAMYKVRVRTHFLGTICGRIFGFEPWAFRCEHITHNADLGIGGDYRQFLMWIEKYKYWLRENENYDYVERWIDPNIENLAVCGFLGMSVGDCYDFGDDRDIYGEFYYRPFWNRGRERDCKGVEAWFKHHLSEDQRKGLLLTTESVRSKKQICIFWPSKIDGDDTCPEERLLNAANAYSVHVEEMGDDIWRLPLLDSLDNRGRISVLEVVLYNTSQMPWLYYHLANEYRVLGEARVCEALIANLWYEFQGEMIQGLKERVRDEYGDVLCKVFRTNDFDW